MRFTALLYLTAVIGSLASAQNDPFGFANGMKNLGSLFQSPPSVKMEMPKLKDPVTATKDLIKMFSGMPEMNPIKDASTGVTNAVNTLQSLFPKMEAIKMPENLPSMEITMPKMADPVAAVQDLFKNLPTPKMEAIKMPENLPPMEITMPKMADPVAAVQDLFKNLPTPNMEAIKMPENVPPMEITMPKMADGLAAAQDMIKNIPEIQGMNPLKMLIDQGLLIPKEFIKDTKKRMTDGFDSGKKFIKGGSDFLKLLKSTFKF
ncbi:extracellular glycoprotein lacritin [Sorex araneus]|uniref:extracellular glycoprotein lacritin n=1 Tax=Sorex araneus TaxID=42254 RepID=UPI002433B902|nr:extracellular glycoprotein lacritin [Sorex araneus]